MNIHLESTDSGSKTIARMQAFRSRLVEIKNLGLASLLEAKTNIPFDFKDLAQADSSVARLVEDTCLRYPSVHLTGFLKG